MAIGECRIIQVLLGIRTSNDPQGLKKTHLVFLCDTAWSRYPLEDGVGGQLEGLLSIILFYNYTGSVENKGNG